jgi:hypothetical protein
VVALLFPIPPLPSTPTNQKPAPMRPAKRFVQQFTPADGHEPHNFQP